MPNDLLTQAHSPGRTPGRPELSTRALAHTPTPLTNYHSGRRAGRQLGEGVKRARTKATLTACLRRRDPGKYPRLLATAPARGEARRGNTEGEEPARPQVPSARRASPGQGHCMLSQRPSGDVGTEGPLGLMAVVWGEHTRHTRGREQCRWFTRSRGGEGLVAALAKLGAVQAQALRFPRLQEWLPTLARPWLPATPQDRRRSVHSHTHSSTREANGS